MSIAKVTFLFAAFLIFGDADNQNEKLLLRKKRYLVFPEGSSLSIAICMTAQMGITPGELFTEGINWGISYELPNDTKTIKEFVSKPKDMMQRRHRRDLYFKIENIMRSMGYNGRQCVLRALCEASRRFEAKGESLVDEILRIVFRYTKKCNDCKGEEHYQYYDAFLKGKKGEGECHEMYPECLFSLIDLALGYYSASEFYPGTVYKN